MTAKVRQPVSDIDLPAEARTGGGNAHSIRGKEWIAIYNLVMNVSMWHCKRVDIQVQGGFARIPTNISKTVPTALSFMWHDGANRFCPSNQYEVIVQGSDYTIHQRYARYPARGERGHPGGKAKL
jgi:hypothetical protein